MEIIKTQTAIAALPPKRPLFVTPLLSVRRRAHPWLLLRPIAVTILESFTLHGED
jgi:hypothetical protein